MYMWFTFKIFVFVLHGYVMISVLQLNKKEMHLIFVMMLLQFALSHFWILC